MTKFPNTIYVKFLRKLYSSHKKCGTLHDFACYPCAACPPIFSIKWNNLELETFGTIWNKIETILKQLEC